MDSLQMKKYILEMVENLESSIDENINFETLRKYKNILVIRSAKTQYMKTLKHNLSSLCSINHFYLVGDYEDYDTDYYEDNVIDLYPHVGKIDNQFVDAIKKTKNIKNFDAVIYLSYEIFRPTYLNIVNLANKIRLISGADIYAYQVKTDKLVYLNNPQFIQFGIETLPHMVDTYNQLVSL